MPAPSKYLDIENATAAELEISEGINLWYRTWGCSEGVPVLFVHGGPGNCVGDYQNVNKEFFDPQRFFVVEVDQRGTGLSTPSVRQDHTHMQAYLDISIHQMSADFERIREHLDIERWLVFGGSWGSTLGLDYAERYPARCLGLIVRGIYLNTRPEFDAIYARASFDGNQRRQAEFDTFFELAASEAERLGEKPLDPDDSERFIRVYETMILAGNKDAIWRFFVFENNLMEEDPEELLDPCKIDEALFPEAQSVAFFEARLFLRGTFDHPIDLLANLGQLEGVYTWVVQGTGDEVCPDLFARQLVSGLEQHGVQHQAHFVPAGHKSSSDGIKVALQACVQDFLTKI
eukprot:TRINITY_DN36687_c0_g1_i1.p1 TRINITY_DN36687_c0_g1~~TRINITY_DN36687_c0_g1_i1.p1  ORF type:complete len:346 (+),score=77.25 TRINITY_DN36687_c0_g1_i1:214-1251(+)